MRTTKLSSTGRATDRLIAAMQLFLTGYFAWWPLMYASIFARAGFQPQTIPTILLVLLCTAIVVAFSVLFAARAFRDREVKNLARVMAIINSFILFLFGAFMLINSGGDGIAGLFFFLVVVVTAVMPLAIVTAVVSTIGCISLLLPSKKKSG